MRSLLGWGALILYVVPTIGGMTFHMLNDWQHARAWFWVHAIHITGAIILIAAILSWERVRELWWGITLKRALRESRR